MYKKYYNFGMSNYNTIKMKKATVKVVKPKGSGGTIPTTQK